MKNAIGIAATITLMTAGDVALAGTDVKLDELPKEVRATVDAETKGGRIEDIERDTEDGKAIYEVEFVQDNQEFEIDIAKDGKLLERRRD